MISPEKSISRVPTEPRRGWIGRFGVGDEVRTVGGGGPYDRGRISELADREGYYRVDYGLGYLSSIREENLEPFDAGYPMSEPPRSFVPPVLPFAGALRSKFDRTSTENEKRRRSPAAQGRRPAEE